MQARLVNKIYPGLVKKYNKEVPGQPMHVLRERVCFPFWALFTSQKENINKYLEACYRLGLPKDALFVTSDLHSRRSISAVSICSLTHWKPKVLANLAAVSQLSFFSKTYTPIQNVRSLEELKKAAEPKWTVEIGKPIMVTDLIQSDDLESRLREAQKQAAVQCLVIASNDLGCSGPGRKITISERRT